MTKRALVLIDLQKDFMPGGALGVKDGFAVIPVVNKLLEMKFDHIIASKDWHPADHKSFASNHNLKVGDVVALEGVAQILWPVHCVQETDGAEFTPGWDVSKVEKIIYKGCDRNIDSYSAFYDNCQLKSTHLHEYLKEIGITDLYFAGIATDYCVKYSVTDALILGYNVHVIKDACRAVNLKDTDEAEAFQTMFQAGAHIVNSEDLKIT